MFNHTITLYNLKCNPISKLDEYKRTVIYGVHWEDTSESKLDNKAVRSEDITEIVIPNKTGYVEPNVYAQLTSVEGVWTVRKGDLVLKGLVDVEVKEIKDLNGYDVRTISSISNVDYAFNSKLNNLTIGAR